MYGPLPVSNESTVAEPGKKTDAFSIAIASGSAFLGLVSLYSSAWLLLSFHVATNCGEGLHGGFLPRPYS